MKKYYITCKKNVLHFPSMEHLSHFGLAIILFLIASTAFSQSLSLFDLDASNFPIIKAKFYAFDKDGKQITSLNSNDIQLFENGQIKSISNISCPAPQPPKALSSVLVIDASGSMAGLNIEIAKEAATAWVDGLPNDISECAITSFDQFNYLNQDFTTDKDKLLEAINNLQAMGSTDYDAALINPLAGGLNITKYGKHKKVLVMLTDGQAYEPQIDKIISEANAQNVTIYAVTLGMECPESLKIISTQTGGQWFESITKVYEAKGIYTKLLRTIQGDAPCTIEWESSLSCFLGITNVELQISSLGLNDTKQYIRPSSAIAKLAYYPTSIKFLEPEVGKISEQKVTITANNATFSVNNITISNAAFDINPKSFVLNKDESIELTISYLPADSGYNHCKFELENELCTEVFFASGGWKGKRPLIKTLKLIHPNGGEVFVAGSDTVITWEGISPDDVVRIEYRIADNQPWIKISDTAKGFSYNWRIPKTPSNKCLARITADINNFKIDNEMILIPAGTFQMGNTGPASGQIPEKPVHPVTISNAFWMSKYEITQIQYEEIMGSNPSYFQGINLPVEMVSWFDAIEFCNKLSEKEGLQKCYSGTGNNIICDWNANGYRLPTESEWEYAAKAGTTTDYYNGNLTYKDCKPLDDFLDIIGWYCGNSGDKSNEVGQKFPNDFGLYDMSGNVWEWCWDWRGNYPNMPLTDSRGPGSGTTRVLRGGSWNYYANNCRSSFRDSSDPNNKYNRGGFRICRSK